MPAPWGAGAQARIVGEIHGSQTVNVLHFATNEVMLPPNPNAQLLALVEAIRDCVIQTLLPAVTDDWRFVKCDARMIYPTPSDPIEVNGTPATVGDLGASSVSFAASLIDIRTGQGGRSGRGRIFLPPAGEAQTQQSLIDDPTLVLIAAFLACVAAKFMGANPTTQWRLGVLSQKQLRAVGGTFDAAFRQATALNTNAEVALMSSRKKGKGA